MNECRIINALEGTTDIMRNIIASKMTRDLTSDIGEVDHPKD
jgi:alkylation response protein AidB-like acyl-CoA dehydrogenase